ARRSAGGSRVYGYRYGLSRRPQLDLGPIPLLASVWCAPRILGPGAHQGLRDRESMAASRVPYKAASLSTSELVIDQGTTEELVRIADVVDDRAVLRVAKQTGIGTDNRHPPTLEETIAE